MISQSILTYTASGKFMLFGEYLVLQGVDCLAIPLKFGQKLEVEGSADDYFSWTSKSADGVWFSARFNDNLEIIETSNEETAEILIDLLKLIKTDKSFLFEKPLSFTASADFNLAWGLGSSSTLVSLLSQWSYVDPYFLLKNSFGGSGYDIACATEDSPICYSAKDHETTHVRLSPAITNKIIFVYSGNKQNSRNEIKRFSALDINSEAVDKMNEIIKSVFLASDMLDFEKCIEESEELLSSILQMPILKSTQFSDYPYGIKSMGAWGGDFFMATYRNEEEARNYFNELGYTTQFTYSEIIKG